MLHNRVFLVKPDYPGPYKRNIFAGLGYIAETLEQNGVTYQAMDMELGYKLQHLLDQIKQFQPSLVGITMMTFRYKNTYQFIGKIRQAFPDVKIIVGGPHVTTFREEVLKACPAIDYGVVGEGETAILQLCQGEPPETIKGLLCRDKGEEVIYTGERPFEADLDKFPFPRYRHFDLDKYSGAIPVITSRGCPHSCIFCHVKNSMGRKVRVRSVNSVVDELEYWYKQGKRRIGIGDDNFTFYRERVAEICGEIMKRKLDGLEIMCGTGLRADKVDRELLQLMKNAGFGLVAIGVEGGNDKVLASLKKGERMETIQRAIADACDVGFNVELHFVVGAPEETWGDIKDSLAIAEKFPVYDFWFNNLIPYPKTELYQWVEQKGYFTMRPEVYFNEVPYWMNEPVFETPILSVEERKRAIREAALLKRRVKRRYFRRKLAGYGPFGYVMAFLVSFQMVRNLLTRSEKMKKLAIYLFSRVQRG